jgi:hypothetical protein
MMNKACLALIIAMCPATLFAGVTMVTRTTETTRTTGGCNFRVDKCATSVANDPDYFRYKDGNLIGNSPGTGSPGGSGAAYYETFKFRDYAPQPVTVEDLVALIRSELSNCPEVTVSYDENTGDITVHYLHSACDDCDWVVNVRNVTADDFVWKRTSDNYSPYLGQMERQKFHTTSEQNAQKIESACEQICKINNWSTYK